MHVSTRLVKSGLCLSRRPRNNLIALPLSDCSRVKPLLFYFHYELHIFRSDKCCNFFVKLNEPLSYIVRSSFLGWLKMLSYSKLFHLILPITPAGRIQMIGNITLCTSRKYIKLFVMKLTTRESES